MSVRPIDSLSIATDRLKAAIEEYRAALADVVDSRSDRESEADDDHPQQAEAHA